MASTWQVANGKGQVASGKVAEFAKFAELAELSELAEFAEWQNAPNYSGYWLLETPATASRRDEKCARE